MKSNITSMKFETFVRPVLSQPLLRFINTTFIKSMWDHVYLVYHLSSGDVVFSSSKSNRTPLSSEIAVIVCDVMTSSLLPVTIILWALTVSDRLWRHDVFAALYYDRSLSFDRPLSSVTSWRLLLLFWKRWSSVIVRDVRICWSVLLPISRRCPSLMTSSLIRITTVL